MGFWKRVGNLWNLSKVDTLPMGEYSGGNVSNKYAVLENKEYAEFIRPNRVQEILQAKPDATLDDIIPDHE